jgi:hypothetical protein
MDLGLLFLAICLVESGCNPKAPDGDAGEVGIAQILPIMVAECNRILDSRGDRGSRFTLADRKSVVKSYQMFTIYTRWWTNLRGGGLEEAARRWNGGPTGHTKAATRAYGRKVMAQLRALTDKETDDE